MTTTTFTRGRLFKINFTVNDELLARMKKAPDIANDALQAERPTGGTRIFCPSILSPVLTPDMATPKDRSIISRPAPNRESRTW